MVFSKLLRSFYGADKLMASSVLLSVPPDTSGEHLKTSNTDKHTGGIKISGRRSTSSGVFGYPWPGTKIL